MNRSDRLISGLYAIADNAWNPCGSLAELAGKFLQGGCRVVQLRMKGGRPEEMLREARAIMALKFRHDFTFIVNDCADIAMEVGADGVHVGEHDTPVRALRERCGSCFLIGYSSHSIEEAARAVADGADYVAFGAIFPTKTKGPGHPVQGVGRLRELVQTVRVPVVAIGGIGRSNVGQVMEAGACAVAMITALVEVPDIVAETEWFVHETEQHVAGGTLFHAPPPRDVGEPFFGEAEKCPSHIPSRRRNR